jgi:hypothetical protein
MVFGGTGTNTNKHLIGRGKAGGNHQQQKHKQWLHVIHFPCKILIKPVYVTYIAPKFTCMKWMLFVTVVLVLAGCDKRTETQKKVEESVAVYVKKQLPNPENYKPVTFSKAFTNTYAENLQNAMERENSAISYLQKEIALGNDVETCNSLLNQSRLQLDSLTKLVGTKSDSTVLEYILTHTYQYTNEFNASIQKTQVFSLDTNFVVLKAFDYKY